MKKKFFASFVLFFLSITIFAQQTGEMIINGRRAEYQIEKQYRVGPGAVYTKYRFMDIAPYGYKMVVNVIEMDQTNQYLKQAPYLAEGTYFKSNTQVTEHKRQKNLGRKPLASVMGNAFTQVSTGTSLMPDWSVSRGLTIDGAICHSYTGLSYYIDADNNAGVGNLSMSISVSASAAGTMKIGNINRVRSNSALPTLFCNGFGQSRDVDGDVGVEAVVQLKDASVVGVGTTNAVVTAKRSGSNHSFQDGYAIISGKDGEAFDFVNKLQVGDNVTISVSCLDASKKEVSLRQVASPLFGYGVLNGVAQTSKMSGYAQCAVGVSQDGKKSYWIEMDNVFGESDASVSVMNQFMQQVGIYNALLMDGGPSAEMQIAGEWVSVNSLGNGFNGRAIPSALMIYSLAPDDNNIYEVDMVDKEVFLKKDVPYTPVFYAYNKYGDMIDVTEANKNVWYLQFEGDCGMVAEDGQSFIPTAPGEGNLKICLKGSEYVSTTHVIVSDVVGVRIEPKRFYTSTGRGTQATLYLKYNDGSDKALDNAEVQWGTSDHWVATCDNGDIQPGEDGSAEIIATYDGMSDICNVSVVNVEDDFIDLTSLIDDANDIDIVLAGTPRSVVSVVTPKKNGNAYFEYKNGEGQSVTETLGWCTNGYDKELTCKFKYDDTATYPVTISGVNVAGGTGDDYFILKSMKVYYVENADGILSPADDSRGLPVSVVRDAEAIRVKVTGSTDFNVQCDVYSFDGKLLNTVASVNSELLVPISGYLRQPVVACVTFCGKKYVFKLR